MPEAHEGSYPGCTAAAAGLAGLTAVRIPDVGAQREIVFIRVETELGSVTLIVTKTRGGLGNQLFQYAAGQCLSEMHDTSPLLDTSWCKSGRHLFWLEQFRIDAEVSWEDRSQAED